MRRPSFCCDNDRPTGQPPCPHQGGGPFARVRRFLSLSLGRRHHGSSLSGPSSSKHHKTDTTDCPISQLMGQAWPVLGVPLEQVMVTQGEDRGLGVPVLVHVLCCYMLSHGVDHELLVTEDWVVDEVRHQFLDATKHGHPYPLKQRNSASAAAGLLRLYLHDLPHPLLPNQLVPQLLALCQDLLRENSRSCREAAGEKIWDFLQGSLSSHNVNLLSYLSAFLHHLHVSNTNTSITAESLSRVLGRVIVGRDNSQYELTMSCQIAEVIIIHYNCIFHNSEGHTAKVTRPTTLGIEPRTTSLGIEPRSTSHEPRRHQRVSSTTKRPNQSKYRIRPYCFVHVVSDVSVIHSPESGLDSRQDTDDDQKDEIDDDDTSTTTDTDDFRSLPVSPMKSSFNLPISSPILDRRHHQDVGDLSPVKQDIDQLGPISPLDEPHSPIGSYQNDPIGSFSSDPIGSYSSDPIGSYSSDPIGSYSSDPIRSYSSDDFLDQPLDDMNHNVRKTPPWDVMHTPWERNIDYNDASLRTGDRNGQSSTISEWDKPSEESNPVTKVPSSIDQPSGSNKEKSFIDSDITTPSGSEVNQIVALVNSPTGSIPDTSESVLSWSESSTENIKNKDSPIGNSKDKFNEGSTKDNIGESLVTGRQEGSPRGQIGECLVTNRREPLIEPIAPVPWASDASVGGEAALPRRKRKEHNTEGGGEHDPKVIRSYNEISNDELSSSYNKSYVPLGGRDCLTSPDESVKEDDLATSVADDDDDDEPSSQSPDSCVSVSEYWDTSDPSPSLPHEERRLSERSLPLVPQTTRRHRRKTRRKHSIKESNLKLQSSEEEGKLTEDEEYNESGSAYEDNDFNDNSSNHSNESSAPLRDLLAHNEPVTSCDRGSWGLRRDMSNYDSWHRTAHHYNRYDEPTEIAGTWYNSQDDQPLVSPRVYPNPQQNIPATDGHFSSSGQSAVKILMKNINSIKKKIKKFEEEFEAAFGYRPSHSDKMKHKDIKKYMAELSKARKEVKQMKEDVQTLCTNPNTVFPLSLLRCQESTTFNPPRTTKLADTTADTLKQVEDRLNEKRNLSGRPNAVGDMTCDEIQEEKTALQKALLYYESVHGRPSTREDRDLARPLYDRYRLVKRSVVRTNSRKDNLLELAPILEHEAMDFTLASPQHRSSLHDPEIPTDIDETQEDISEEDKSISTFGSEESINTLLQDENSSRQPIDLGDLHALPLSELHQRKKVAKEKKKNLRRELRDYEEKFERETGRKVQKEDRGHMEPIYIEYKHAKAKLRLLEALISKHETNF